MSTPARDLPAEVQAAVDHAHEALDDLVAGRVESSRRVYRQSEDITLFGAYGGHDAGWSTISRRLEAIAPLVAGASSSSVTVETLAAAASGDLAYTVELEHHRRVDDAGPDQHREARTLRVTQIFTRVDGEWKLVHRHADPLSTVQDALSQTGWDR